MIEVLKTVRGLWMIKSLFFNTLYFWTVAFDSFLVINLHEFLVLFAHTS
jgi:hypothetical protein